MVVLFMSNNLCMCVTECRTEPNRSTIIFLWQQQQQLQHTFCYKRQYVSYIIYIFSFSLSLCCCCCCFSISLFFFYYVCAMSVGWKWELDNFFSLVDNVRRLDRLSCTFHSLLCFYILDARSFFFSRKKDA